MKTFLVDVPETRRERPDERGPGGDAGACRAGDLQSCVAGRASRAVTASASAVRRERTAVFEPTSASDAAMIR